MLPPMRIARKPSTAFAALLGRRGDVPTDRHAAPLATGRAALEIGLRALGVTSGARVLLPSYICDVILLPLQRLGLSPLYYDLDDHLSPDWASLEAMLPSADAALLFHPFGQPQDSARFAELCRRRQVFFIEDNAHGWGAESGGKPLGTMGDMGFVSPWKQYAVPHGAFLYLRSDAVAPKVAQLCDKLPVQTLKFCAPFAKAQLRKLLTLVPWARLRVMRPSYLPEVAAATPTPPLRMSPAVMRYLARQHAVKDAARRRAVYKIWEAWAQKTDLRPVFTTLHNGAAPLCFPAYASTRASWQSWLEWGWRHDLAVHAWPTLPEQLRLMPHVLDRWNRLLCFPVHQKIEPRRLLQLLNRLKPPCPH